MSDIVWKVLVSVVASGITGAVVWLGQRALWHSRRRRKGRFFGLRKDEECLLVVPRQPSSDSARSVDREDVVALLELAGLLNECGARWRVVFHDQATEGLGRRAEFSIAGTEANTRTATHLRVALPGVAIAPWVSGDPGRLAIRVGAHTFSYEPRVAEHALLAKIAGPALRRPVFLICGQTATANQGAIDWLIEHRRELARGHGLDGSFAVVVRVVHPSVYGRHTVQLVRDVTGDAFAGLPSHVEQDPA